jgi:YesN/AraC family two-component response regulator
VGNYADQEVKKIVETIATRYTDQNLSLHNLSKDIGISPTKVSELLQKNFNLSFKQYLNNIRLAESQRLLRDTDRQVSEIAYAVGYTSVTHFHRVFKQVFDQSPNEYRKIVKKE